MPEVTKTDNSEDPKLPRNECIIGGVLALIGVGLLLWQYPWIEEVRRGPRSIADAELLQMEGQAKPTSDFIVYEAKEIVDTGLGITKKNNPVALYLLIPLGDKWAVASVPADQNNNRIVGYIKTNASKGLDSSALDTIREKFPKHALTSFYFQASKDQTTEVWCFIAILTFLIVGGGAYCLYGAVRWWKQPSLSDLGESNTDAQE